MPIITISRGTFSGGKELAECLAAKLDVPCLSREVIVEAAQQYGASEGALNAALSHAPSLMDRFKRDRERYLAYIRAVLCTHAQAGDFVYHGHAGHHLLAGVRHVVRVRVVADIAYRVRAAMEREGMTSRQAEAHIKKVDEARRAWTRFLYGVAWDDPSNYDIVLNLEYLGLAGACAAVLCLAHLEPFQATDESRRALDNLALKSLVTAALSRDERTCDSDLTVRADAGVVTIEGVVRQHHAAEAVSSIVASVAGVKQVVSQVVTFGVPV
jgi:cytidylate kinase